MYGDLSSQPPMMDPEYQLPEHTGRTIDLSSIGLGKVSVPNVNLPEMDATMVAPLAALGVGLAGAAVYFLTRKKEETLGKRVSRIVGETLDDAKNTAEDVYSTASDYAQHEGRDAAKAAMKKGRKLFKMGREVADERMKQVRKAAKHTADDLSDYAQHNGRKKAKEALARTEKSAKKTVAEGRKATEHALDRWEKKYPLVTGLLLAALLDSGQKYFRKSA